MRRLFITFVSAFLLAPDVHAVLPDEIIDELITIDGQVYTNVRPLRYEDRNTVVISHSTGIEYLSIGQLPDTFRKHIGLPTREDLAERRRAERIEQEQQLIAQREREEATRGQYHAFGRIIQIVRGDLYDGILIRGIILSEKRFQELVNDDSGIHHSFVGEARVEQATKRAARRISNSIDSPRSSSYYFIAGYNERLVDGDIWAGTVYYAGIKQYTSALLTGRTVRQYATTRELASGLWNMQQ